MPTTLHTEKTIFLEAAEIASPAKRAAFLERACGDNQELRAGVEALLLSHQQSQGVLDVTTDPLAERPGTQIGPYKLLQQIGEGGMGTVFMAEQTEPVQRKVALKVIKPGMDSRQVIARFEAERQALAMMDHVNIARVLDAGATEQGRPYFVMELVHGVPITKYCDDNRLTPRQRLELFVPVCQAIQHAHQKGIIHRDIKPSNVMVTLYDGQPVPKVIDFGVAKATEQKLTERTLFTQYGTMVGTLEYMSPEQAEMSALGVDTRSDIYSLGVLLYELLTGSTPLSSKRMKEAAYAEILRLIKEEEPPKPSTRLSESGESLASISAQRHMEPAKLSKLMRGELDWIVMKTLEKDRNRRYETAKDFAADVQRYLGDEPVQACPPSVWYRFRKFARRNRTGLLTASVLGAALLVATSAIGWSIRDRSAQQAEMERQRVAQQLETERERAAARQQSEQERLVRQAKLGERINQALEETQVGYERDRLPEALTAIKRAEALLASDSGVSIELRQRVEQWRAELTILERLEELAFRFSRDQARETDAAYSKVFLDIGIKIDEMPVEQAGKQIRSRLTWQRLTESLDRWVGIRQEIAALENFKGDGSRSKQRLLQVARAADSDDLRSQARLAVEKWDLAAAERLAQLPEVYQLPASTLRQLAMVIFWGEGGAHRQSAVQLLENAQFQRPGDFQLNVACASYYMQMNPPQLAEAAHYWSIAIALRPDDGRVWSGLALVHSKEGKVNQAIVDYRRAIELDPKSAPAHNNFGTLLYGQEKLNDAIVHYRKAIELDPESSGYRHNLGQAFHAQGHWDEALDAFSKAIELDPKYANSWSNRGVVYGKLGQLDKAVADYSKAIELDPKLARAWTNRGGIYKKLSQPDKALADYSKATELDPKDAKAWSNRGLVYGELAQWDKALADFSKAIDIDPKLAPAWANKGWAYGKLAQWDKSVADLSKAIELDPSNAIDWNNRGGAFQTLGKREKALADFSKAIELDPKYVRAWIHRGLLYAEAGELDKALADFSKVIELDPKAVKTWYDRARVYVMLDQPDKALADFSKAIELDPTYANSWSGRGTIYQKLGQDDRAVADFSKAIEQDLKDAKAWGNRGVVYQKLGQGDKALADYSKAIELEPKYVLALNNRASAYMKVGQWAKAAADYARIVELEPKYVEVQHKLAGCHVQLGRYQEALDGYRQLVERFPKVALPHNDLAWLLATCTDTKFRDPGRAVELATKAVELTPKQGDYWNTLGVAHYRAGEWKSAVMALEKSMELRKGGDANDWLFLAMTHWQLDHKEEARKWFDQAVSWMEKAVSWMEKNAKDNEELIRFRNEAIELMTEKP